MSSASSAVSIGIDFGTSNTVVAIAADDRRVEAIRFDHGGQRHSVYVSALCFWEDRPGAGAQAEGGPWAIEQFLEGRHVYRFLQSFKTFAASSSFNTTQVFRQRYKFEDILAAFLRTLARHGGEKFGFEAANITVGRPVRFAGGNPDEALAMQRYRAAWAPATRAMSTSQWVRRSRSHEGSSAMPPCWLPISAAAPAISP